MADHRLHEAVRDDVQGGLVGLTAAREDSEGNPIDRPFLLLDDDLLGELVVDNGAVLAWKFSAVHDGLFQGIPATGRHVEITGCTYVLTDEDPTQFVRFVDWASVLAQMGVTFNTKPLVDEDLLTALDEPTPVS